jgi:hypothetical protein
MIRQNLHHVQDYRKSGEWIGLQKKQKQTNKQTNKINIKFISFCSSKHCTESYQNFIIQKCIQNLVRRPERKGHLGESGIDGRLIFKWILKEQGMRL